MSIFLQMNYVFILFLKESAAFTTLNIWNFFVLLILICYSGIAEPQRFNHWRRWQISFDNDTLVPFGMAVECGWRVDVADQELKEAFADRFVDVEVFTNCK